MILLPQAILWIVLGFAVRSTPVTVNEFVAVAEEVVVAVGETVV